MNMFFWNHQILRKISQYLMLHIESKTLPSACPFISLSVPQNQHIVTQVSANLQMHQTLADVSNTPQTIAINANSTPKCKSSRMRQLHYGVYYRRIGQSNAMPVNDMWGLFCNIVSSSMLTQVCAVCYVQQNNTTVTQQKMFAKPKRITYFKNYTSTICNSMGNESTDYSFF